jgi:hypothetical protein
VQAATLDVMSDKNLFQVKSDRYLPNNRSINQLMTQHLAEIIQILHVLKLIFDIVKLSIDILKLLKSIS